MTREDFEAWAKDSVIMEDHDGRVNIRYLNLHDSYIDGTINTAWRVWQAATQSTIKRIQAAAIEPVLLPGAIVLPGDFFAKVK